MLNQHIKNIRKRPHSLYYNLIYSYLKIPFQIYFYKHLSYKHLYRYVELEGVEPSSKRGNHKPSTCLSLPKFLCISRTKAINSYLIF
ncbi:hypothetical protein EZS27_005860 [termite gut metagenome]|uniref:Uncharacterized protein n=1 Tax=termite gut metagenome TaxID=433724 RepID=A0A5J4SN86_9ZZZZ